MDAVRRHQKEKADLDAAVDASVDEMPEDFVIRKFIIANRAEVKAMLLTEYNEEKVMEKERQEGHREGLREGRREGLREGHKEGQKEMAGLMKYLLSNGRNDDALKASSDETFLNKLLADFRSGLMAANNPG